MHVAKAEPHPLVKTSEPLKLIKNFFALAAAEFAEIENLNTQIQVHGKGYLSKDDLAKAEKRCENLWKHDKALVEYIKTIKHTSLLPVLPTTVPVPPAEPA